MRTLRKNKQKLYYALKSDRVPQYELDDEGNIKTINIDGVDVPVETGDYEMGYSSPVEFNANIILSGGDSYQAEFGIDISQYDAILVMDKDAVPITETSLIWHKTKPKYKDASETIVDGSTADYAVVTIKPSINQLKAVLRRIVK